MSDGTLVLDTSALFAILLGEPEAQRCASALASHERILLSAGTLTEILVVGAGKDKAERVDAFLGVLRPEVIPLTAPRARASAEAYRRWGKTFHPAKLNLADTYAYALAIEHGCPLLFVGNDFGQTDVMRALG